MLLGAAYPLGKLPSGLGQLSEEKHTLRWLRPLAKKGGGKRKKPKTTNLLFGQLFGKP